MEEISRAFLGYRNGFTWNREYSNGTWKFERLRSVQFTWDGQSAWVGTTKWSSAPTRTRTSRVSRLMWVHGARWTRASRYAIILQCTCSRDSPWRLCFRHATGHRRGGYVTECMSIPEILRIVNRAVRIFRVVYTIFRNAQNWNIVN